MECYHPPSMRYSRPLVRKHKKLARALLYLSPILLWLVATEALETMHDMGIDSSWSEVDYEEYESFRIFRDYLRIDSSYPDGNEIPAAEFLAEKLRDAGFEVHLERLGARNANLWTVLEGDDPRPLVLHNHVDVDPVEMPERWRHPPFEAVYDPPFVFGRGAFDMKSVAVAQLMVMLDLKRSGVRPQRSLFFLATGDEERDSFLGTQRLLRQHPAWHDEFWAVLTEGGAVEAVSIEDPKYWGTEFQQKRFVDEWVCGSLREDLESLRRLLHGRRSPRRLTQTARIFFPLYASSRRLETPRELLADPSTLLARLRSRFGDHPDPNQFPPLLEAMVRDEIHAWPVDKAPGGGYRFRLIYHLLPDSDFASVREELVGNLLEGDTTRVVEIHPPVPPSPIDHPLFRTIDRTMADRYPGAEHGPLFVPWSATDARFFRAAGIPSYGFSPFLILSAEARALLGANERIPAPAFVEGVDLYGEVVRRAIGAEPGD